MTDVPSPIAAAVPAALRHLPLTLSVRVGTAKTSIRELIQLAEGSLVTLDSAIDTPVEICVDNRPIALGDLIERENGEGLAVKITSLITENDPQ